MQEIESIRKIKSASLKRGRTVDVKFTRLYHSSAGNVEPKCTETGETLAHEDLLESFKKLESHLIAVCEMNGLPEDFEVSGFMIAEGKQGEGVTLQGSRRLSTKKILSLETPVVEYDGKDYPNGDELESDINSCIEEVKLYLDGKCAIKQVEINFNQEDENTAPIIADGTEPKRKGRKKKATVGVFVDGGSLSGSTESFEQN